VRCPSEATIRRVVRDVDADRFDAAIGEFVQQRCAALAPPGRRRALAIDGKTVRVRHEVACGEWITSWRLPMVT
jgi:hypothetical protein